MALGSTYHLYLNKLSKLQNKALKIVNGSKLSDSPVPIYLSFNVLTLSQMATFETAKFIFKHKNNRLPLIFNHHFSKLSIVAVECKPNLNYWIFLLKQRKPKY